MGFLKNMLPCRDAQAAGIVMSVSGALVLVHVENLDFHKCALACRIVAPRAR